MSGALNAEREKTEWVTRGRPFQTGAACTKALKERVFEKDTKFEPQSGSVDKLLAAKKPEDLSPSPRIKAYTILLFMCAHRM